MPDPTWADGPMCAFDTETTGVDTSTARIVTAALVRITPGQAPDTRKWLLNPGVDIPEGATQVHGITTEYARDHGTDPVEGVAAITAALADELAAGTPLVIMNAPFDLSLLESECRRHNVPTLADRCDDDGLTLRVIDPMVLDKHIHRFRSGKRTLAALAAHYRVELSEADAHTAAGDCLAAARVAWRIARADRIVGRMSLDDLHALQVSAHLQQAASLENYLRKNDPTVVIDRDWPIRTQKVSA